MVSSWIPRRLRPRNLGYLSLALLSGDNESEDEYDEKTGSPRGSFHDDDDDRSDSETLAGGSPIETLVGDSPIESGLLAGDFDEKACYRTRRPTRIERLVSALRRLDFLLPSFLVDEPGPTGKLHPSAWLDGLRGWAAFLVVWHHTSLLYFSWTLHDGWRSGEDPNDPQHNRIMQLPFFRLLIAGAPQVKIFFVISGFALSYKPLKLARSGRYSELASALGSSVFRRHPRLFMPAVLMMTLSAIGAYYHLFGGLAGEDKWNEGAALMTRAPPVKGNATEQAWDLYGNVLKATNPFSNEARRSGGPYDWNLWTLSMEFDCSMILFLCLAAFSRLRTAPRLVLTICVAAYALWWTHWSVFLFVSGMLICDLHFAFEAAAAAANGGRPTILPTGGPRPENPRLVRVKRVAFVLYFHARRLVLAIPSYLPRSVHDAVAATPIPGYVAVGAAAVRPTASRLSSLSQAACIRVSSVAMPQVHRLRPLRALKTGAFWRGVLSVLAVVASLFLMSMPENNRGGRKTPYFQTIINDWTPKNYEKDDENHWWLSLGAVVLVFTIERNKWMQRIFTTAPLQYLGRISYALYLVHGPLLFSVGWHLGRSCTNWTGRETQQMYATGIAFAYALLWPLLIWASDVVARLVDDKSVAFAKWAYDSMAKKGE